MKDLLLAGLNKLELDTNAALCDALLAYVELLQKWNNTYNLTAVKDPVEILNRHILDSLSVATYIKGPRCLDIGTGAGLPGLILALLESEHDWILLDSNQKKLRFLRHVKAELGINNVEFVHSRVEEYQPEQKFNTLICRAFAPLPRMLEQVGHLLNIENRLLAMKGKQVNDEVALLDNDKFLIEINDNPFFTDESLAKLVQIRRSGKTI